MATNFGGSTHNQAQQVLADITNLLSGLNLVQLDVVHAIVKSFAVQQVNQLVLTSFLTPLAFDYFSMRLAAHHAYSSNVLKKENFEHILEQAFKRTGVPAQRANSMTLRGADLTVNGVTLSLKTEAAANLKAHQITISKLMEAAWIKTVLSKADVVLGIQQYVLPHFANYQRVFILRSYPDPQRADHIRYDLHEIPKGLLQGIGGLQPNDFSDLTLKRSTAADVYWNGARAFRFRLDGSDDKLTITHLDVALCPLHAWWSLPAF